MNTASLLDFDPFEYCTPGRNDPCHCDSGKKYKRCHEPIDRQAWRYIMLKARQAATVYETVYSTIVADERS